MKFLIVGCGSIGRRHIRNLQGLGGHEIVACDTDQERLGKIAKELGVRTSRDYQKTLEEGNFEAVFICTPNDSHVTLALEAARRGFHLFIEKPLSHNLEGVDELIERVELKSLTALVGCNLRFHPSLVLIKKFLEEGKIGKILFARIEFGYDLSSWHPAEDYRKSYSASRKRGGGVVLDAIHELDYARWFFGPLSLVSAHLDKISRLEIETEDTAEILLRTDFNALVSIHLDYLQRDYHRSCLIVGDEGTLRWRLKDQQVELCPARTQTREIFEEPKGYELNTMYVREMEHFMDCLKGKTEPAQDLQSARQVLEMACKAKEAYDLSHHSSKI